MAASGYDQLTPRQRLAALLRILARHDYDEKLAGHASLRDGHGDTLLVNPLGVFWSRVRAADVLRVDLDGRVVEGEGAVNPTILFHTELHRALGLWPLTAIRRVRRRRGDQSRKSMTPVSMS